MEIKLTKREAALVVHGLAVLSECGLYMKEGSEDQAECAQAEKLLLKLLSQQMTNISGNCAFCLLDWKFPDIRQLLIKHSPRKEPY